MSEALPIFGPAPAQPLCQTERGSCAACCGLYNFRDRNPKAQHARLQRRTERVQAAYPDVEKLREARDALLAEEAGDILFAGVKVCPFAGYVEEGRVGCLLHPTRHPHGEELRHLAVYPAEVCAGHFCAPHDWLRPHEAALAATVEGVGYGRVVTDAGLVKALTECIEARLCGRLPLARLSSTMPALRELWTMILAWPYADPDPNRFGGFVFTGDDAVERSIDSALAAFDVEATRSERVILDALGSRFADVDACTRALERLRAALDAVAKAIANDE